MWAWGSVVKLVFVVGSRILELAGVEVSYRLLLNLRVRLLEAKLDGR